MNTQKECPCKKESCVRHGNCGACMEYHKTNKHHALPYCQRAGNKKADSANKTGLLHKLINWMK